MSNLPIFPVCDHLGLPFRHDNGKGRVFGVTREHDGRITNVCVLTNQYEAICPPVLHPHADGMWRVPPGRNPPNESSVSRDHVRTLLTTGEVMWDGWLGDRNGYRLISTQEDWDRAQAWMFQELVWDYQTEHCAGDAFALVMMAGNVPCGDLRRIDLTACLVAAERHMEEEAPEWRERFEEIRDRLYAGDYDSRELLEPHYYNQDELSWRR